MGDSTNPEDERVDEKAEPTPAFEPDLDDEDMDVLDEVWDEVAAEIEESADDHGGMSDSSEMPAFDAGNIAAAISWSFPEDCPMGARSSVDGKRVTVEYGGPRNTECIVTLDYDAGWTARLTFEGAGENTGEVVANFEQVLDFVGRAITARYNYVERRPPGRIRFSPEDMFR
jgi:hypothetical protein